MKIVKVNSLPQTYEADTVYLVKSSTAGLLDIYVTDSIGTQIRSLAIDTAVINSLLPISEVGVSVASLVDGKVPTNQLPSAILGALSYQGTWNASSNSPAIPVASDSNKGWYYVVSVAGATPVSGVSDWEIGDWLVSNGTSWGKVDNSDKVSSVAGKTGAVTLSKTDVGLGNVDNTSDVNKPVSTATQTALNLKANLASPALTTPVITGTREKLTAMSANTVDLATGNYFTKTISGATTFTVTNVPATGTAASFILELTNAGSAAITWFSGVKWAGGTPPTLTASGVDVLGFYTHNGGSTWRGMLLSKDSK